MCVQVILALEQKMDHRVQELPDVPFLNGKWYLPRARIPQTLEPHTRISQSMGPHASVSKTMGPHATGALSQVFELIGKPCWGSG